MTSKIFKKAASMFLLLVVLAAVSISLMGTATTVSTWSRVPSTGAINLAGTGYYGAFIQASGTFAARTDTFYFPFSIPYPKNSTDTIGITAALVSVSPTDSVNVLWAFQYSMDNANWSTAVTVGQDSSATAATIVRFAQYGKQIGAWYLPYARFRAIGQQPGGGKANKVGDIIKVALLNTQ